MFKQDGGMYELMLGEWSDGWMDNELMMDAIRGQMNGQKGG